jgi:hypothetical protein
MVGNSEAEGPEVAVGVVGVLIPFRAVIFFLEGVGFPVEPPCMRCDDVARPDDAVPGRFVDAVDAGFCGGVFVCVFFVFFFVLAALFVVVAPAPRVPD